MFIIAYDGKIVCKQTPGRLSLYKSDALVSKQEIWLEDKVFDVANTNIKLLAPWYANIAKLLLLTG